MEIDVATMTTDGDAMELDETTAATDNGDSGVAAPERVTTAAARAAAAVAGGTAGTVTTTTTTAAAAVAAVAASTTGDAMDVVTKTVATDLCGGNGTNGRATDGGETDTGGTGRAGVGETGRRDETAAPAGPRRRAGPGRQAGMNRQAQRRAKAKAHKAAGVGGQASSERVLVTAHGHGAAWLSACKDRKTFNLRLDSTLSVFGPWSLAH